MHENPARVQRHAKGVPLRPCKNENEKVSTYRVRYPFAHPCVPARRESSRYEDRKVEVLTTRGES